MNAKLLQTALEILVEAVEESVRLRVEGRSKARGSKPGWLERAAGFDVELVEGSTSLLMHGKPLAETCPEVFAQSELFEPLQGNPTGVDVFAAALADVVDGDRDSDLYDDGLLATLMKLDRLFKHGVEAVELVNGRTTYITQDELESVRELRRSIPADQRARVSGTLDALRHSNRTFELVLSEGEKVRGVLLSEAGEIAEVGTSLGSQVLVEGVAKFRASGRLLRLDAEWLAAATSGAQIWATPPRPLFPPLEIAETHEPQGPRSGAAAIFGAWPGEETDEEIEVALRELS
ncbi:MAG TPA: hypothetical protein VLA75_02885 [Thermoanaerobaculia bacterium]|nr:hypothetical protein [Thermoanaerobaculia bacterium]